MPTVTDYTCAGETGPALYNRLAFLDRIANRQALSVNYQVLALTRDHVRAAARLGQCAARLTLVSTVRSVLTLQGFWGFCMPPQSRVYRHRA
jgi:hypothetical protein